MHLAASSTPVAVKCRAMDLVYTIKIFPVLSMYASVYTYIYSLWVNTNETT
jgi:hypothetical protein